MSILAETYKQLSKKGYDCFERKYGFALCCKTMLKDKRLKGYYHEDVMYKFRLEIKEVVAMAEQEGTL